jgi:hypothetical protein
VIKDFFVLYSASLIVSLAILVKFGKSAVDRLGNISPLPDLSNKITQLNTETLPPGLQTATPPSQATLQEMTSYPKGTFLINNYDYTAKKYFTLHDLKRSSPLMFQFETINYYFYKSREDRTYTCVVFYTVSKYFYPPGLRISGKFNLRLVMDICKSAQSTTGGH